MQYSFTRILNIFRCHWVENRRLFFLGLIAMTGIMALLFFLSSSLAGANIEFMFLQIGLFFFGTLFTSSFSRKLSGKSSRIHFFTIPAAAEEKLLVAIIFSMLIFPLIYLLFVSPSLLVVNFINTEIRGNLNTLNFSLNDLWKPLPAFLAVQSFVLLCATLFKRFALPKTVITLSFILIGVFYLNSFMIGHTGRENSKKITIEKRFYDQDNRIFRVEQLKKTTSVTYAKGTPFSGTEYTVPGSNYNLMLVETELPDHFQIGFKVLLAASIVFLWMITWFRLRESQL